MTACLPFFIASNTNVLTRKASMDIVLMGTKLFHLWTCSVISEGTNVGDDWSLNIGGSELVSTMSEKVHSGGFGERDD